MGDISSADFNLIRAYAKKVFGLHLSDEKKTMLRSRLKDRIRDLNMDSFNDYYEYLKKTPEEEIIFIDKVTTNYTYFLREKKQFDYFYSTVLPYIEKNHNLDKDLRVWCAGCSSGEEAYTLGIYIKKYFGGKSSWNTELLATDISVEMLSKAIKGIYSRSELKELEREFVATNFDVIDNERCIVNEKVKNNVTFRRLNLVTELFEFKKPLQVIFCRNVMIYFDEPTKQQLVQKFYDVLEPGGYFFISQSESLNNLDTKFQHITSAVYRKPLN